MSIGLNKVMIMGNVTATPVVKEIEGNGTTSKVASFNVAINNSWKDKTGKKQESVEYAPVVLWGKLAELAENYIKTGKALMIEGSMKTRNWEEEVGGTMVKRFKTEVLGDKVILLGGKSEDSSEEVETPAKATSKIVSKAPAKKVAQDDVNLEDIPF